MSKNNKKNIAEDLAKEQNEKEAERIRRKKLAKSKAKAGRINADKRSKK